MLELRDELSLELIPEDELLLFLLLLPRLPELLELELPCMPDEPTEPERRLGSFERSSERPMFFPKLDCESLFDLSRLDDVERLTSPALVLPTFLLILSRSRFSI